MNLATFVTFGLTLLCITVSAYKIGPPVGEHHHLCDDMNPHVGHGVEAITDRPAPYELTAASTGQCYRHGSPLTVKLTVIIPNIDNITYFEGLFVLARRVSDNATANGQFDVNGDDQLQTLTCGHTANNAIGHSIDKHYTEKVFKWTPASDLTEPVYFIATVVRKKVIFWLGVTSPHLHHDPGCVYLESSSSTSLRSTSGYIIVQLVLVFLAAAGAVWH